MLGGGKAGLPAAAGGPSRMEEDDPNDQDTMRKRLEEFKRRKALEKIKQKADRQRGVDPRSFVVPPAKKDVIPEIVPSIMNDAPAPAPAPPVAAPIAPKTCSPRLSNGYPSYRCNNQSSSTGATSHRGLKSIRPWRQENTSFTITPFDNTLNSSCWSGPI
ncbi:hypothetical protein BC829DRAFT_22451 [Chytridium lagenaria]|nr:hypothetical protein BC829DRAFT_22451 [Chytridium lagenaria]